MSAKPRVLIVSYYFYPLTGAPVWRAYSWWRYFPILGLTPVILTRYWNGNETVWDDHIKDIQAADSHETDDERECIRVASKKFPGFHFFQMPILKWLNKTYISFCYTIGVTNPEINAYESFKAKTKELVLNGEISAVIITGPPSNIYHLAKDVKSYSNLPVIIDVRDLNNNETLDESYRPGFKQKFFDFFYHIYFKKWLTYSDVVTAVTPIFAKSISKEFNRKAETVYNGFDGDFFEKVEFKPQTKFTVSYIGALYFLQEHELILNGLKLFLENVQSDNVQVLLPGLLTDKAVGEKFIKSFAGESRVMISERVTKQEAIEYAKQAHVLLFTAWPMRPGVIPAKSFDYIASGNRIINCASDNSIIAEILMGSKLAINIETKEELCDALLNEFKNFTNGNWPIVKPDWNFINKYSRNEQAILMANIVKDQLYNK